nr:CTP synthase 2 isoform X2 [Solanum lycopersicum]
MLPFCPVILSWFRMLALHQLHQNTTIKMNCILPQQVLALKERLSGVPLLEIVTKTHRKPNGYRRFFRASVCTLELKIVDKMLVQQCRGGCCIIPGGFGERDVEGKILAAKYVRENRIPYLGICLGMQIAVIEYARSILGLQDANSTEFDPNTHNLWIIFMPEGSKSHMGVPCVLDQEERILESKILNLCRNRSFVDERHRHRYEKFEDACLSFPGKDESDRYMEVMLQ